jgi:four helix bundle protein
VGIAKGSAGELKYRLWLATDLGYINEEEYNELKTGLEEISKMLNGLIKALSSPKH